VSLFAWRLLHNKLHFKDNLMHRGMPRLDSLLCASDFSIAEISNDLFF
jgi:hypothetical protein